MNRDRLRRARREIAGLAGARLDWVGFVQATAEVLAGIVSFDRSCWHTVDPGTVLFTGSLNQNVGCSGTWLATYEYLVDDVNKWWYLARSGRIAGATSLATHGDLSRSPRHRSHQAYGIGDELRVSFVIGGTYWAAAGLLRDAGQRWFTEDEVRCLALLAEPIADGFRRALLVTEASAADSLATGPGVIVFDGNGNPELLSPGAEHWIGQMVEIPPPRTPAESKIVQAVAAMARSADPGQDPLRIGARSRVRTRSGSWLLLYGTRLAGGADNRTAVIIQPATPAAVAPLVTLAYGLSERESQVTRLCMQGLSTRQMAHTLALSPHTVQDHLKSIFAKTGARSRSELVGQIFLEHYVPRWEDITDVPAGWLAKASPMPDDIDPSRPASMRAAGQQVPG
ncbi:MAG TPA: helix-turn-helix transcriptional regulator [Actinomycetes bacterium]|nr:helix-turn-helix transcriptional regulator [Actinomycetes bacterium]